MQFQSTPAPVRLEPERLRRWEDDFARKILLRRILRSNEAIFKLL
ncbi:hypothetical protein [Jiella pelagia]|uniref:Uncharacterized protein n=1 Tax=Jiella pelagia TaxID=2986949 RepID=A0ABY7C3Z4_9HYPH|nr:hypothetical protein [Jiella pelagia]WAP70035.1 hypothetical protein OH818_07760 [Jiella pelagia]